jgi:hypothetical protein
MFFDRGTVGVKGLKRMGESGWHVTLHFHGRKQGYEINRGPRIYS